jgi:WD40 repeat protein
LRALPNLDALENMLRALQKRESALASLEGAAAFGHRRHRFHAAALGDVGLAQRLEQSAALTGHSGAVNALCWTEAGDVLASGGEDCRLRLWRSTSNELLHACDTVRHWLQGTTRPVLVPGRCRLVMHQARVSWHAGRSLNQRSSTQQLFFLALQGHTATILSAAFLPASRGEQLLCCSADRQIRHVNVVKGAVRPYLVHQGRVRAVVPLDARAYCC